MRYCWHNYGDICTEANFPFHMAFERDITAHQCALYKEDGEINMNIYRIYCMFDLSNGLFLKRNNIAMYYMPLYPKSTRPKPSVNIPHNPCYLFLPIEPNQIHYLANTRLYAQTIKLVSAFNEADILFSSCFKISNLLNCLESIPFEIYFW